LQAEGLLDTSPGHRPGFIAANCRPKAYPVGNQLHKKPGPEDNEPAASPSSQQAEGLLDTSPGHRPGFIAAKTPSQAKGLSGWKSVPQETGT